MKKRFMLLLITVVVSGLAAGIFFCWSVSTIPGLKALDDKEYILAFQSLNRAILNPLFFACFIGTTILLPFTSWTQFKMPLPIHFWFLLIATAFYLLGVIAVTAVGNIPLNNSLEAFNVSNASNADMQTFRNGFETKWNMLNHVRTVCSLVSFSCTAIALWKIKN